MRRRRGTTPRQRSRPQPRPMTVSDDEGWRPACGGCGSTSLTPAPDGWRFTACGAEWDGSEAPEASLDDERPYVCPGCHAVGGERCAPDCIDAAIEAAREDDERHLDEYDHDDFSV